MDSGENIKKDPLLSLSECLQRAAPGGAAGAYAILKLSSSSPENIRSTSITMSSLSA